MHPALRCLECDTGFQPVPETAARTLHRTRLEACACNGPQGRGYSRLANVCGDTRLGTPDSPRLALHRLLYMRIMTPPLLSSDEDFSVNKRPL